MKFFFTKNPNLKKKKKTKNNILGGGERVGGRGTELVNFFKRLQI